MAVPRYQARPRPRARSGGYTGSGVSPAAPAVSVTVTSYESPCCATVYGPSAMYQVPGCRGPGRYPGVASSARTKNALRAPPDHPRNPRPPSSVPRESKSPDVEGVAGGAGRDGGLS